MSLIIHPPGEHAGVTGSARTEPRSIGRISQSGCALRLCTPVGPVVAAAAVAASPPQQMSCRPAHYATSVDRISGQIANTVNTLADPNEFLHNKSVQIANLFTACTIYPIFTVF